jgi:hypothetical protein
MLMSGVKRIFQMSATTTGGSTMGTMKIARTSSRNRMRPFSRSAMAKPMTIWSDTVQNESCACTHTEFQKRPSAAS